MIERVVEENRWVLVGLELAAVAATFVLGGPWWGVSFVILSLAFLAISLVRTLHTTTTALRSLEQAHEVSSPSETFASASTDAESERPHLVPPESAGEEPASESPASAEDDHDLFFMAYAAATSGDVTRARQLASELRTEKEKEDPDEALATELFLHALAGITDAVPRLRRLADEQRGHPRVVNLLISALWSLGDGVGAIDEANARRDDLDGRERGRLLSRLAEFYLEKQEGELTVSTAQEALEELTDDGDRADAMRLAGEGYELKEQPLAALACLENAAKLQPNNTTLQFRLAYLYANQGVPEAALVHYESDLRLGDHPWSRNNLGVAFSTLNMHHLAFKTYAQAARGGNSLAAANIAKRLIDAGASEDARRWLDLGKASEGQIDPQVYDRESELQASEKAEVDRLPMVRRSGEIARRFFGEAATAWPTPLPAGTWQTPLGKVEFTPHPDVAYADGTGDGLRMLATQSPPLLTITVQRGGSASIGYAFGDKDHLTLLARDIPKSGELQILDLCRIQDVV